MQSSKFCQLDVKWIRFKIIFLYNCMQCIDGFSILSQRYVIKGNDAKNPAIFSFCLLPKEPILVPRGRAPFGQHQESRPLASSNDIPILMDL